MKELDLYSTEIIDFILHVTRYVCLKHRCMPTAVWGKWKRDGIPAARLEAADMLQERLCYYDKDGQRHWMLLDHGEALPFRQKDIVPTGHAIECRINAEDPDANFAPRPGRIDLFFPPMAKDVRVDSHVHTGYVVPPQYDSLIAKLIVKGSDRPDAIRRTREFLDEFLLEGIPTTKPFHRRVLEHEKFLKGEHNTGFVDDYLT